MLIDGVEVEEKYEGHQTSHGLRHHVLRSGVLMKVSPWKQEGSQRNSQQQGDDERRSPEPPFPSLNSPEVGAKDFGLRVPAFTHRFCFVQSQRYLLSVTFLQVPASGARSFE